MNRLQELGPGKDLAWALPCVSVSVQVHEQITRAGSCIQRVCPVEKEDSSGSVGTPSALWITGHILLETDAPLPEKYQRYTSCLNSYMLVDIGRTIAEIVETSLQDLLAATHWNTLIFFFGWLDPLHSSEQRPTASIIVIICHQHGGLWDIQFVPILLSSFLSPLFKELK